VQNHHETKPPNDGIPRFKLMYEVDKPFDPVNPVAYYTRYDQLLLCGMVAIGDWVHTNKGLMQLPITSSEMGHFTLCQGCRYQLTCLDTNDAVAPNHLKVSDFTTIQRDGWFEPQLPE
jgi:hypothetical protein